MVEEQVMLWGKMYLRDLREATPNAGLSGVRGKFRAFPRGGHCPSASNHTHPAGSQFHHSRLDSLVLGCSA